MEDNSDEDGQDAEEEGNDDEREEEDSDDEFEQDQVAKVDKILKGENKKEGA